ncbi:ABC transporter substrate-binding protein [Streptomyces sp. SCSIO 30461]|uniref:ABC transporter substrate-binding protein n=1 Tax=Streptomyces sp. SCSIO 30461 TaxID=3118085 RepID=UPI0030CBE771
MDGQKNWSFLDDRGHLATAARRPHRTFAYIQAGATLWDHGIRPAGLFGSNHDGAEPDPVKAAGLPLDAIAYLGSGAGVDAEGLLAADPDVVVAVSYGGGQVYALDPDTVKHIEERVPLVVLDIGRDRSLAAVRARFAELARELGAEGEAATDVPLARAESRLRDQAAAGGPEARPTVLALSPASADGAYLAKPYAWPDLRELVSLGLDLVDPQGGSSTNWSAADWSEIPALAARMLLVDMRVNAHPLDSLRANPAWQEAVSGARLVPWNPEAPCSARAQTRFFTQVADAVEAVRSSV